MTGDRTPAGDTPTHGVHVIPGEVPEGTVPPSTSMRTPELTRDLRERLAEALHCPTCGVEPGAHCLRARVDNRQPHMTRVREADAVLPVVEAETAALRERAENAEADAKSAWQNAEDWHEAAQAAQKRAEQAERERDEERTIRQQTEEALAIAHDTSNQSERARQAAERALAQARDAIADERRGKLAAEAAVRRAREVARNRIAVPADVLLDALTIEQPKENPDE